MTECDTAHAFSGRFLEPVGSFVLSSKRENYLPVGQDSQETPICPSDSTRNPRLPPQNSPYTPFCQISWNLRTLCWNSTETTFSLSESPQKASLLNSRMLGIKTLNASFSLPLSHRVRYIL